MKGWLVFFVFILILGAFLNGAQRTYVALTLGEPVELPCADYLKTKPAGMWLRLSGCTIDLTRVLQIKSFKLGVPSEYYAPVGTVEDQPKVRLLLKIGAEHEAVVKPLFRDDDAVDRTALNSLKQRFSDYFIEGTLHVGFDTRSSTRDALTMQSDVELAAEWDIVEERQPPSIWSGVLWMTPGLGVALLYLLVRPAMRRQMIADKAARQSVVEMATPENARVVEVEPYVSRLTQLAWVGGALCFMLVPIVVSTAVVLNAPLLLIFALMVVGTVACVRAHLSRVVPWAIWVVLGYGVFASFLLVLEGGDDATLFMAAAYLLIGGGAWFAMHSLRRVDAPELALKAFDLLARGSDRRPGPFASGRYVSVGLYLIWSGLCTAIALLIYAVLFALTRALGFFLPIGPDFTRLLGPRLVRPLMFQGSRAAHLRRRYASPEARRVLQKDTRAPVVLLRSFNDDELATPQEEGFFDHIHRSDRTFEEVITDQLWRFGPVVAIGRPGEAVPQSGAVREYVAHDEWQGRVEELTGLAGFIVLILGPTPGFAWELQHLKRLGRLSKAILVMPPLSDDHVRQRWATLVSEAGTTEIAADFVSTAGVPGALCSVWLGGSLVILRAADRKIKNYCMAINLCASALAAQAAAPQGTGGSCRPA